VPILGLDHYNLQAPAAELKRLRDFYCHTIGLIEGERPAVPIPGYWLYAGNHPVLHLQQSDEARHAANPPIGSFDHIAFRCEGFEAMRDHLNSKQIAYHVNDFPAFKVLQIVLRDSAGNGVELNYSG
jgi:catechol-2,3-dioxygenase